MAAGLCNLKAYVQQLSEFVVNDLNVAKQLWKHCLFCLLAVYVSKAIKAQGLSSSSSNPHVDVSVLPPHQACTLELCAGIVDKDVSLEEIARQELLEEVGYDVPVSKLEKIVVGRSVAIHAKHTYM